MATVSDMTITFRPAFGRVVAAALLAVAALPATAVAVPQASTTPADLSPDHRHLVWKTCTRGPDDDTGKALDRAGAQCADLTVPLDYASPGGRTIGIAVARLRAADPAHRIGTLLYNMGGPADPAIESLPAVGAAMGETARRYDIVGVDPRFTGRNTPLNCGWRTETYFRSAGSDRAGFERMRAFERGLAEQCRDRAGALLPYVSTRNAARDMDAVRAALGERRISFYGVSYGTYLGEVYTAMFPGRTDRVVLDGVHDPSRLAPWAEYGTEQVNEDALRHWAGWAAAHDRTYGLGATADAVLATLDGIQAAAVRRPLSIGAYRVDRHVAPLFDYAVLGDDTEEGDALIAGVFRTLKQAADTGHAEPDAFLTAFLAATLTGDGSSYGSTQTAYLCADTPGPRDTEVHWRAIERTRARHPLFGPILNNVTPCSFWPRPKEQPITTVHNNIPALMVNTTGDPRVPYSEARQMHARWPASRLVTVTGSYRHGVYGTDYGDACVNDTVNGYLATGRLPTADLRCGPVRPTRP